MPSPWVWNQQTKRYRDTETGRFINARQMTGLRDAFVEAKKGSVVGLADSLQSGDINIQRWVLDMRDHVKQTFVDQYVLAKGGRNNMTQTDWGRVGAMVKQQYGHLQDFGQQIADGQLSVAQIKARSQQYIDSSTQAFERGKQASYGMPALPQNPADGNQDCLSGCKCGWAIVETDEAWECTWELNAAAEHCNTCVENAGRWNPLIIPKSQVSANGLERYLERLQDGRLRF